MAAPTTPTAAKTPYRHGWEDGQQDAIEHIDHIRDAIAEHGFYRLGRTGWDDALVNAMGTTYTAELFGVEPETREWDDALLSYNTGAYEGALAYLMENGVSAEVIR